LCDTNIDMNKELTHHEKKNLAHRIEQLKNKKHYKRIFQIVHEDSNRYTVNDNGVYLNINTLPSSTLIKIISYLNDVEKNKVVIPVPNEYIPYSESESSVSMSTQERHFFKRLRDSDQEMKVWGKINTDNQTEAETSDKPKIDIAPLFSD